MEIKIKESASPALVARYKEIESIEKYIFHQLGQLRTEKNFIGNEILDRPTLPLRLPLHRPLKPQQKIKEEVKK